MNRILALALAFALVLALSPFSNADVIEMDIPYLNTDPNLYQLEIDLTNQIGTIYQRDGAGGYSIIVRQFLVTTGNKESPTPSGTFKLGGMRERFGYFLNFKVYAQYWTQVVRGIYLHSVLYTKRDESALTRASYNNLGKNVSHGCIRMLVEDARFIYYNCPPGTEARLVRRERNSSLKAALKSDISYKDYAPAPDPIPEVMPVEAYILNDNVPLRTGFSLGRHEIDRTLTTLNSGDEVSVLQAGPEWVKVQVGKREGYIQTKHVRAKNPSMKNVKTTAVNVGSTKLYKEMSNKSQMLGELPGGTPVTILDSSQRLWYLVRANGLEGYVQREHIGTVLTSIPLDAHAEPVIAISPSPEPGQTPEQTPQATPEPFLKPLM